MMFEYAFGLKAEGALIRKAVAASIDEGFVTEDLTAPGAPVYGTSAVGDRVAELISKI